MERKGSDINSFQGDPRIGVGKVFSFPRSIPKEEGGAQTQGIMGDFSPESWFLPAGAARCSQANGDGCTQGLSRDSRGLWGVQEHFQS